MKIISKIKTCFNSKNANKAMFVAALSIAALLPEISSAGAATFEKAVCNALTYITGPLGAAIATLAIVILGIGAMLGKIAWTTVLICCCGIAAVFGGGEIVTKISGSTAGCGA